jgi:hypothetical protein
LLLRQVTAPFLPTSPLQQTTFYPVRMRNPLPLWLVGALVATHLLVAADQADKGPVLRRIPDECMGCLSQFPDESSTTISLGQVYGAEKRVPGSSGALDGPKANEPGEAGQYKCETLESV